MWHIYKASYILFFLKYGALSIETEHVAYILYMPHVLFLLIKPHISKKTIYMRLYIYATCAVSIDETPYFKKTTYMRLYIYATCAVSIDEAP